MATYGLHMLYFYKISSFFHCTDKQKMQ